MKKNLLVVGMVAVVAIFSLQDTHGQDATQEQIDADLLREHQAQVQAKEAVNVAVYKKSTLTPEQQKRFEEVRERIRAQQPPVPTNYPARRKDISGMASKSQAIVTDPPLSQGERMQFRNLLMTDLMWNGSLSSLEQASSINQMISDMNTNQASLEEITATAYVMAAAPPDENGGIQTQNLLVGRTIDYTSNPYVPINTVPFPTPIQLTWFTDNIGSTYPWSTMPRTLVSSNGPAAQSYMFPYGVSGNSYIRTIIQNHYDWAGNSVRHILALWYILTNTASVAGMDTARVEINVGYNSGFSITNLGNSLMVNSPVWRRKVGLYPAVSNTNGVNFYEFMVDMTKTHYSGRYLNENPVVSLDPSVQWIPYWLPPISSDLIVEKVGNEIWVEWSTLSYQYPKYKLRFATSLNAPITWSTNIGVAVNITNEVAIAKFAATNPQRYYSLISQ